MHASPARGLALRGLRSQSRSSGSRADPASPSGGAGLQKAAAGGGQWEETPASCLCCSSLPSVPTSFHLYIYLTPEAAFCFPVLGVGKPLGQLPKINRFEGRVSLTCPEVSAQAVYMYMYIWTESPMVSEKNPKPVTPIVQWA